jgi:hypothetical protein
MKCACGCGMDLPKCRIGVSKYRKGHYSKMRKENPTERQRLLAMKKKIMNNKRFVEMYKKLLKINKELDKIRKKYNMEEFEDFQYENGKNFCGYYDNDNITCVMCFERNEKKPYFVCALMGGKK